MQFIATNIPDVILIEPRAWGDERGFFMETYRTDLFSAAGIPYAFVQDNHSGSHQGVLRGLHYQIKHAQGKLVRVAVGEIYDVAVDLRRTSPTFGQWVGSRLSTENRRMIWIPPGFAHGIYVLSEWAELLYKTTDFYSPESERTLLWNDADLNIDWHLVNGLPPVVSEKDLLGKTLQQAEVYE